MSTSNFKALWNEWQGLFWVSCWFVVNVLLSICNKSVFQFTKFNYPLTLSICHLTFVGIASFALLFIGVVTIPEKANDIATGQLWFLSLLFWCNIAVGNLSLQLTSLALSQVVRSIIPGITMILSYFVLQKRYSCSLIVAVSIVIVGVIITTWADVEITVVGLTALLTGSVLAAAKVVITNKYLTGAKNLDPIYLLSRLAPISVVQMTVYGMLTGEFCKIRKEWAQLAHFNTMMLIFATSVMSFFINYTNFMTNKTTSPLTLTVAGNVKQITTIALGIVIFGTAMTTGNTVGIVVTICGTGLYSYLTFREKQRDKIATATGQKDKPVEAVPEGKDPELGEAETATKSPAKPARCS